MPQHDALSEILEADQDEQSFEARKGDAVAELIYPESGSTVRPLGAMKPPELRFRPDVSPARERLGFGASFKVGMVDDPGTKLRLAARAMFPDDPEALRRFGFINGRMVYVNDDGKLENVQGGFLDWLGGVAANLPEMVGGALGGGIGAAGGPATAIGGAALGAAAGEGYKRVAANVLLDEPQSVTGNVFAMGSEAALSGAGEAIGLGIAALRGRRAVKGLDNVNTKEANAARAAIREATGIELDLAQVTNNPKLKALKLWARNYPGQASELIKANDDLIAGQVDDAIERLVGIVSRETDTAAQGLRGMNAARAALETARTQVAARAGPLYRRAFAEGGEVNTKPVLAWLDDQIAAAKGPQGDVLRRVRGWFFAGQGTDRVVDTTVEGLHATKLAIDALLETGQFSSKGATTAISRGTRRQLTQLLRGNADEGFVGLLDQIGAVSESYNAARQVFAAETARLVDPLQNSVVGVLAALDDRTAATAAAKLFADGNVTPQMIGFARRSIQAAELANPEMAGAWNGIVRQWMSQKFVRAAGETQTGEAINVAGKFRQALIRTETQKAAMREAIGQDAIALFDTTMDALQMVSRTPTASSATEFNRLISEELSPGGSIIRGILQPRQTVIAGIQERVLERNAKRIAEALTDPLKVAQLRALQGISDREKRALAAMGVIGVMSIGEAGNSLLFPPDTEIPPVLLEEAQ